MKKATIFLLALVFVFGLAACSRKEVPAVNIINDIKINTNNDQSLLGEAVTSTSATGKEADSDLTGNKTANKQAENSNNDNNKENTMTNTKILAPSEQPDLTKEYSRAILHTSLGDITLKFYAADAPLTVNNFLNLAHAGFYNGTKFHRVIQDFMIQGGDPLSRDDNNSMLWGTGGPDYKFQDEINNHKLVRGSLAMANAGAGTNGSQFFIVTAQNTPWLDGHHTNFGEVVEGLAVVDRIEKAETGINDRPLENIVISSIELLK